MKKKLVSGILIAALAAATLTGCSANSDSVFWTVSAPPGSSALYPLWVAYAQAISSVYPQYRITVSESQGVIAITKNVRSGYADFGNSAASTDYENYNGVGTFEGKGNPDMRMLFYYEMTAEMFCVSQDSGITTLQELDGERFNPGGTGTTAEDLTKKILDVVGVEPDYFDASQSDASDAYSNREIVGTVKLGPVVDSYVMQLDAAIPVNIIDLDDETIAQLQEAYPYLVEVTVPGGTYTNVPDDVHTVATLQGCQTTKNLSQEDGYNICKAIFEDGKSIWQSAYPNGAENDLVALTLSSAVPLHAGTVQYLTELGYEVPEDLIPEEYVPVQ